MIEAWSKNNDFVQMIKAPTRIAKNIQGHTTRKCIDLVFVRRHKASTFVYDGGISDHLGTGTIVSRLKETRRNITINKYEITDEIKQWVEANPLAFNPYQVGLE